MIKDFGQWEVVKDGITTIPGCEYYWISKEDIMNKNTAYAKELMKMPRVNKQSLTRAFEYAYRYFHSTTKYTKKSHPEIYKAMMSDFSDIKWFKSRRGFTTEIQHGLNITVFQDDKGKWKWVYRDIFSKSSYKSLETAKKKAFGSYYWLYEYVKKNTSKNVTGVTFLNEEKFTITK